VGSLVGVDPVEVVITSITAGSTTITFHSRSLSTARAITAGSTAITFEVRCANQPVADAAVSTMTGSAATLSAALGISVISVANVLAVTQPFEAPSPPPPLPSTRGPPSPSQPPPPIPPPPILAEQSGEGTSKSSHGVLMAVAVIATLVAVAIVLVVRRHRARKMGVRAADGRSGSSSVTSVSSTSTLTRDNHSASVSAALEEHSVAPRPRLDDAAAGIESPAQEPQESELELAAVQPVLDPVSELHGFREESMKLQSVRSSLGEGEPKEAEHAAERSNYDCHLLASSSLAPSDTASPQLPPRPFTSVPLS